MSGRTTGASGDDAHGTVEALIRAKLGEALGGKRGVVESAVPTILFTVLFLTTDDLRLALIVSIGVTAALLLVRVVQRQPVQFTLNALFGIGIAAVFASRSGEARDVFLPGILYNGAYAVVLVLSIVIGWPVVGFLIGSVMGDPTSWRDDRALVRLCSKLTAVLAVPCVLRVVIQYPLYAADQIALLGTSKIVLGWPLQVASLFVMGWLLSRNSTPIEREA